MIEFLSSLIIQAISQFRYFAVFGLMFLESALIPVPSEVVMPFSGFVSLSGTLNFWLVVFFGTLGQITGSVFIFYVGKYEGRSLLEKYGKYILIKKKDIAHADHLFQKHGDAIVFFGRLIPVVRTFISLPAGVSKMKVSKFILYSSAGILPWTLLFAWLGVKMGESWVRLKGYFHIFDALIIGLIVLYFLLKVIRKANVRQSS
ncbi:MAG: DedA family protein [Patescibacteria group bacterium]|nr:DedA family protein [Patescibacteria group bacterium]